MKRRLSERPKSPSQFSELLRRERVKSGLNAEEFRRLLGSTMVQSQYFLIEKGQGQPNVKLLKELAKFTGFSIGDLFAMTTISAEQPYLMPSKEDLRIFELMKILVEMDEAGITLAEFLFLASLQSNLPGQKIMSSAMIEELLQRKRNP